MTDQGPATLGTAARCEELEGALRKLLRWAEMEIDANQHTGHFLPHGYVHDQACKECVGIRARAGLLCGYHNALRVAGLNGEPQASAPTAPLDPVPEIDRLKAENASLLESLRVAEKRGDENWKEAIAEQGRRLAAEQRAEAAEKRATDPMKQPDALAKTSNSMLAGRCRCGARQIGPTRWIVDGHGPWDCARAALHDEEHEAALAHASEAAWVIERGDSQPGAPTYWAGIDAWSQAHLDAVRFRRKEDAERVASGLRFYPNCRICEHMWVGAAPEAVSALHDEERSAPPQEEK